MIDIADEISSIKNFLDRRPSDSYANFIRLTQISVGLLAEYTLKLLLCWAFFQIAWRKIIQWSVAWACMPDGVRDNVDHWDDRVGNDV